MKKALVITLAIVFVFAMASIAFAAEPTGYKTDGKPYWTYKDSKDAAAKNEGGYAPFSDADPADPFATGSTYATSPHGGFDTTTNKCKVCHAVHRAEGAYFMLRADTQDDACAYCHLGSSAHSAKVVYTLNSAGTATTSGHTIGASATIPDSSVSQWTEDVTLSTTDADGGTISETVPVRRYSASRNKMFRFARHHGHGAAGTSRSGYLRVGPLALRCMNCHQPHNATNMIWKPTDFYNPAQKSAGYKLLRLSPSASIWGTTANAGYDLGMKTWKTYDNYDVTGLVNSTNIITVPETTMTAANTGNDGAFPNTVYTEYLGVEDPAHQHGPDRDPQTVNQYALSPWCADCHNLNIGYWKHLHNEELGYKSHADRTHPAPYTGAYNGPAQCYSCHRNDLPEKPATSYYSPARASCEQCHFGTGSYAVTIAAAASGNDSGYDFPHSGDDDAIKMLGNYAFSVSDPTGAPVATSITSSNIDAVCKRCHGGIGINH